MARILTFDGTDCCGKSTIVSRVNEILTANGYHSTIIKFPTSNEHIGSLIRDHLNGNLFAGDSKCPNGVYLMFALDRLITYDIYKDVLNSDTIVLFDRSWISSLLYQQHELINSCEDSAKEELVKIVKYMYDTEIKDTPIESANIYKFLLSHGTMNGLLYSIISRNKFYGDTYDNNIAMQVSIYQASKKMLQFPYNVKWKISPGTDFYHQWEYFNPTEIIVSDKDAICNNDTSLIFRDTDSVVKEILALSDITIGEDANGN